jgi:hypothetical protein
MLFVLQETACPERAPNQQCSDAIALLENVPMEGSLNNAEPYFEYNTTNCAFFEGDPALWYSVEGSDACVTVTLQSDMFETYLAVLEGDDCFGPMCLRESPYWEYSLNKTISFFAERGSNYYVLVSVPPYYGEFGTFTIQAEVRRECQTKEPVSLPVLTIAFVSRENSLRRIVLSGLKTICARLLKSLLNYLAPSAHIST